MNSVEEKYNIVDDRLLFSVKPDRNNLFLFSPGEKIGFYYHFCRDINWVNYQDQKTTLLVITVY